MNQKKGGLAAFSRFWLTVLLKFLLFFGFSDWFSIFLKIENKINKKGANYGLIAKSQFLLNSNDTFLKKKDKNLHDILRGFSSITPKVIKRNPWKISVVSKFKLFHRLALSSVKKIKNLRKIFLPKRRWFYPQETVKCINFLHAVVWP